MARSLGRGGLARSFVKGSSRCFAFNLRLVSALQLLAGVALLALALSLQMPPTSALPLGLTFLGAATLVTSLLGFVAAASIRCCLGTYLTFAAVSLAAQAGFVVYLFADPQGAVDGLMSYDEDGGDASTEDRVTDAVMAGRWVLLGLLGAQVLAAAAAGVLRCCAAREAAYEAFEEDDWRARNAAAAEKLGRLRAQMGLAKDAKVAEAAAAAAETGMIGVGRAGGAAAPAQQQQQQQQQQQAANPMSTVPAWTPSWAWAAGRK